MNVGFSEEQLLLRESARDFLKRECPMSLVRAQMESASGLPEALWAQMAGLGWMGLMVDEKHRGSALGLVDLALLLEQMGRVLLPGPFISTAVVGASALQCAGSDAQRAEFLPRIADGSLRTALAQLEGDASWEPEAVRLAASFANGHYRLSGVKHFVADASAANLLIVVVRIEPTEELALLLVDPAAPGVRVRPIDYLEQTRKVCEVRFDDAAVPEASRLAGAEPIEAVLAQIHDHARVAVCAEACGGAERVLELTVEYARTREQFDQPIGRFQSIQHKCADMLVKTEGIRSAAYYGAWSIDAGEPDRHLTSCLAKAYCCDAYTQVAGEGIQIHGGLGFTWEQDPQLYFKHAKASALAYGSATYSRELAARQLLDAPVP